MKTTNNEHIAIMTNRIIQHFNPVQIILFGSYARGEAHSHSDVDLLVVFSECADKRKTAIEIRRVLRDMPFLKTSLCQRRRSLNASEIGSVQCCALLRKKGWYSMAAAERWLCYVVVHH